MNASMIGEEEAEVLIVPKVQHKKILYKEEEKEEEVLIVPKDKHKKIFLKVEENDDDLDEGNRIPFDTILRYKIEGVRS
jgi:hypothetical protein